MVMNQEEPEKGGGSGGAIREGGRRGRRWFSVLLFLAYISKVDAKNLKEISGFDMQAACVQSLLQVQTKQNEWNKKGCLIALF